jgi:Protein of unknown function (DUF3823) N-terminal domain/Domain of unknown function (DUF3823_C)
MKIKFHYIVLIAAAAAAIVSCKKDNKDAPSSRLSGRLVYQGEPIGVEQNQVPYELYQFGFGKVGAIGSAFAQDGSYSALLFDGDYKLIIPNGQGPFKWKQTPAGNPDSLQITLNGAQTLDLDVIPYYMIRTPQLTAAGGKVSATFKIEKVVVDATAKNIGQVALFINKTQFVSGGDYNIANAGRPGSAIVDPNNVSLEVTIPGIVPAQNYVFARIGVQIEGVEDWLFSPVQKISF